MKVLFVVRATFYTARGGDAIQVMQTAAHLRQLGVEADIKLTNEKIDYQPYRLLHFFNIIRPADILVHIKRSKKPFVVTPIIIDYSLYDRKHRPGFAGKIFRWLSPTAIEYVKTVYRALRGKDALASTAYLWKGQRRSIKEILQQTKCVLVTAEEEYKEMADWYKEEPPFMIVPNGVDADLFKPVPGISREQDLVLCVARVEGIKNQYNLVRALNNTRFRLLLIGDAAPNQRKYFDRCKSIAAPNVSFISHLPQQELLTYYAAAKVHVLPSWFEVCGLSSLEAAAMGCQVVISGNGYAHSYFKEDAFYCDPSQPSSIFEAVKKAAAVSDAHSLRKTVTEKFSWHKTAEKIFIAYKKYCL